MSRFTKLLVIFLAAIFVFGQDHPKIIRKNPITGEVKIDNPPSSRVESKPKPTPHDEARTKPDNRVQPSSPERFKSRPQQLQSVRNVPAQPAVRQATRLSNGMGRIFPSPLRYSIEVVNAAGVRRVVPSDSPFRREDLIQLRVTSLYPGRIFIYEATSGYAPRQLFPSKEVNGPTSVLAGQEVVLPAPNRTFEFDERAGDICVLIGIVPERELPDPNATPTSPTSLDAGAAYVTDDADVFPKGLILSKRTIPTHPADQTPAGQESTAVGCTINLHQVY